MKLDVESIKDYDVQEGGNGLTGGEVSIDVSNMGLFYEMMSKSIYSNPIGSIIRELVSNGFDAHVEAGIKAPVIVKVFDEELITYISFQDFGVGISEERFHDIYLKYLSSSKRDSNEMMGAFGLGSKSPFSYAQMFYILTRYNGTEYYYIMSKGQNAKPNWDLLYDKPTEEPNGTTIKFELEGGSYGDDFAKFRNEIMNQLRYFDDVFTEGFDLENEYKILDYKTFKFRVDTLDTRMHLALGKVTYPIDWEMLKRPQINIPVGVKFEIGELMITPNRESIRYNDELIILINNRIDACLKELNSLTTESAYDDLFLLIKDVNDNKTQFIRLADDALLFVYEGSYGRDKKGNPVRYPFKMPKPTFKPFAGTPIKIPVRNPFFFIRTVGFTEQGRWASITEENKDKRRGLPWYHDSVFIVLRVASYVFRTSGFKINKMKLAYLKSLHGTTAVVAQNKSIGIRTFLKELGLNNTAKSPFGRKLILPEPFIGEGYNKTKLVQLYKKVMLAEIIKRTQSYDRLEVPEDFKKTYVAEVAKKTKAGDEEVLHFDIGNYDSDNSGHRKDSRAKTPIKLSKLKSGMIIYGNNKQESELIAIHRLIVHRRTLRSSVSNKIKPKVLEEKYKVIMLNNVDLNKMEGKNHIPLEKFLKHKVFIEQLTAYYIYKKYETIRLDWAGVYVPAIKMWHGKLTNFISHTIGSNSYKSATYDNKFVQQFMEIALEEGLLIQEYVDMVDVLSYINDDLEMLRDVGALASTIEEEAEVASFLVKKGYKVDPMFTIKLTEEELYYVNAYMKFDTGYRNSTKEQTASTRQLIKEAYGARNKNYSLYIPFTWHRNFPTFGTSKSVKISMLSLALTP